MLRLILILLSAITFQLNTPAPPTITNRVLTDFSRLVGLEVTVSKLSSIKIAAASNSLRCPAVSDLPIRVSTPGYTVVLVYQGVLFNYWTDGRMSVLCRVGLPLPDGMHVPK